MRGIEFHPGARLEWRDAILRYHEDSPVTGARFNAAVQAAIAATLDAPMRYPAYLHGTRMRVVRPFPYLVVYRVVGDRIQVIAVAHGNRRPGYWKTRVYG